MSSSAAKKKAIANFISVLNTTEKIANDCLSQNSWDPERAIDYYLNNPSKFPQNSSSNSSSSFFSSSSAKADGTKLTKLFEKYAIENKERLADADLVKFLEAIDVDPSSVSSLIVAFILKGKSLGTFTRQEFIDGWLALNCDSADRMKAEVKKQEEQIINQSASSSSSSSSSSASPHLSSSSSSSTSTSAFGAANSGAAGAGSAVSKDSPGAKRFREFYRWLFIYSNDSSESKNLDPEIAIDMWSLVFTHWILKEEWIRFCRETKVKAIAKDVWEQLLEFSKEVKTDLSNYESESSAWPVTIDDFVGWMKKQKKR